jgi:hypothetical protein
MQKASSIIVLSLLATGAAAALILNNIVSDDGNAAATSSHFDSSVATQERLLALEAAVSEERQARQLLEDELLALYAQINELEAFREDERLARNENSEGRNGAVSTQAIQLAESGSRNRNRTGNRREDMMAAGLSPERADYILRRESELRYEMMQAYYEARNSGEDLDARMMHPESMLRADIGDADYEKYLEAIGRSTSVNISSVMAASPAESAGLQPGDQIVGYDGERVYHTGELMERTMAPGEGDVVVDIVRDGATMQIVLPRGPIGVETGRFRGR